MTLQLSNLSKQFGGVTAVEDLTLEATDDDFLVLLGPSGSGKTTTLRMIAGLESPTAGEIRIDDAVVNGLEPADRDIAMVFQNYALYPHLSVWENMELGLKVAGMPADEIADRIEETVAMLGIADLTDRSPAELSGGQQQRVALGRAIVRDPSVFLMDEPLSNLDAKLRTQMRKELKELKQRLGTTFVYVTHDQTEAMTMATKIAVLKEGRLQQVGTPEDLYDNPVNEFVATFIGSPSMNMYTCDVVETEDGLALDFGAFRYPLTEQLADLVSQLDAPRLQAGIRPEHVTIDANAPYSATVNVVEPVGSDIIAYVSLADGTELTIETERTGKLRDADRINFDFPSARLHLFADGDALTSFTSSASVTPTSKQQNS